MSCSTMTDYRPTSAETSGSSRRSQWRATVIVAVLAIERTGHFRRAADIAGVESYLSMNVVSMLNWTPPSVVGLRKRVVTAGLSLPEVNVVCWITRIGRPAAVDQVAEADRPSRQTGAVY